MRKEILGIKHQNVNVTSVILEVRFIMKVIDESVAIAREGDLGIGEIGKSAVEERR